MANGLSTGDETMIDAMIMKLVDGGASIAIPDHNFPHSTWRRRRQRPSRRPRSPRNPLVDEATVTVGVSLDGVIILQLDKVKAA